MQQMVLNMLMRMLLLAQAGTMSLTTLQILVLLFSVDLLVLLLLHVL
jgi:hypothetical protein